MAEVNVANMEENSELFMEKMGFPHDALCHQVQYGMHEEEYEEDCDCDHDDGDCDCGHDKMMMPENGVKVKVMRLGDGNVHEMMNEILGGY
jgi:hypothetical protein